MNIANLSTELAQNSVKLEAAMSVQKMTLSGAEQQGQSLVKMIESSSTITDPALGNKINIMVD